jgi:prevent-host-death family protein
VKKVGLFEAKSKLSALVEEARRGKSTLITVRGKPAAQLVPCDSAGTADDAISRLLANSAPMGMSIREAIETGRT